MQRLSMLQKWYRAVACKKEDRKEVIAEDESLLWEKGLLGATTAESLLHTVYFYNENILVWELGSIDCLQSQCNMSYKNILHLFIKVNLRIYNSSTPSFPCFKFTIPPQALNSLSLPENVELYGDYRCTFDQNAAL
jgi:hypothetical protein